MSKKIFEFKNLQAYYSKSNAHALKDINFSVNEKEVLSFIGPSGCGKSTMIRSINRMNDFIEGFKIEGEALFLNSENNNFDDIYSKKTDVLNLRTKIGMIFQKPTPFPMSIYDNITYGLIAHGIKDPMNLSKIVEDSLKKAALWDEVKDSLHKMATELSGGQQQRLCIARAIALEPEVLLMDEPTSALDPISTTKIEELIIELKSKFTIILVTHSMHQAQRISDRVAFFLNGELVELDVTRKIFTNPKDKRTLNYITGRY
jgi:phosphate transport system ATP-binding protein